MLPTPAQETPQAETAPTAETETVTALPTSEDYAKLQAALKAANSESASRRKKLEAFEKAEAERQAANMSDLEKANARIAELEAVTKSATRSAIAARHGLPDELANRLTGDSVEEMEADAVKLSALLPKPNTTPTISATSPATPSMLTREDISKMSPQQINNQWDAVSAALSRK